MLRAQGVCALIGALCLGLPSAVNAQSMGVGVKGGLVAASIPLSGEVFDQVVGLQSIDSSSKLGVAVGGYVRFPISRLFWFQPEAMYVMKGANLKEIAGAGDLSARLHYIDVPLLLHFRVRPEQRMPVLFGGVNFGMKVGSSAKLDGPSGDEDIDLEPALKTNDVGIAFGGGIEWGGRYLVEGRVVIGLSDIGAESFPHLDALRNRAIMVLVGRKFR